MSYVIEVNGLLDDHWGRCFADMNFALIRDEEHGVTLLVSQPDIDQAQLHAALKQTRDMGLELLRVQRDGRATSGGR